MKLKVLIPAMLLSSAAIAFANPLNSLPNCGAATLSTYENSYPIPQTKGCAIGVLDYSNFSYHPVSNAPLAGDITLTPSGQGFSFTRTDNNPFIANLGQVVTFEIDFNILIDPAPVIGGADNRLDPPTGNVVVTEFFCNDLYYVYSGSCFAGNPQTLSVGTPVTKFPYSNSILFDPPAKVYQTVGIRFTLDGTNGVSSFDGLEATSQVIGFAPEPASLWMVGLCVLAGGYKLRKQMQA